MLAYHLNTHLLILFNVFESDKWTVVGEDPKKCLKASVTVHLHYQVIGRLQTIRGNSVSVMPQEQHIIHIHASATCSQHNIN